MSLDGDADRLMISASGWNFGRAMQCRISFKSQLFPQSIRIYWFDRKANIAAFNLSAKSFFFVT
jgi:hypothetical protein